MKKNKVAEDNESPRRRATSFRQRINFLCRSLVGGLKPKEIRKPAIEQVNFKTEFDKVIEEHSDEVREHPDAGKKSSQHEDEVYETAPRITDSKLYHSLEITEYVLFLDLALGLVEKRVGGSAYGLIDTFLFYFFAMQEAYEKKAPIKSYEKKYPIFDGHVGVDIALAQEYKRILDEEESKVYWPEDEDKKESAKYLTTHHILSFPDNDIKKLFEEPDAYIDLREKAYASYKGKFPENSKNPNSKDKKEQEQSGFTSKVMNLKERVSYGKSLLADNKNEAVTNIFQNVATEANDHLSKFGNDSYGKGVLKLNAHEKVLLVLFLLERVGVKNIPVGNLASFMDAIFGGKSDRKEIAAYRDNNLYCGYENPKTYNEAKEKIIKIIENLKGEDSDRLQNLIKDLRDKKGDALAQLLKSAR